MTNRPQAAAAPPDPQAVDRLVQEVRRRLTTSANEKTAAEHRRAYGEGVPCYGVKTSQVHHIGLDMVRRMRTGGLVLALEVADPLWRSGNLEEGLVGTQVMGAMGRHIGGGEFERFEAWAEALTNQANADGLALHLVSRSLAARPSLVNRLKEWAQSSSVERRRAAVMAFVPMVREGRFLTDALSVLELVMEDAALGVQDGAGQMLLEASRMQADRVAEFLRLWKDKSPRKLLSKATEKLSADLRSELLPA